MSQAAKVQEPSMEEILASIRRIIADDDAGKPAKAPEQGQPKPAAAVAPARPAAPAPAAAGIDAALADLDKPKDALKADQPKPEPPKSGAPKSDALKSDAPKAEAPRPEPVNAETHSDVLDLTEAMTAPAPAFRTIDGTSDIVFAERPPEPPRAPPPPPMPDTGLISSATAAAVDSAFNTLAYTVIGQNARTLEDLVKEMLRPLLKSWLDDNLPGLVERIVRAEIERVSRGKP
jgi:cell pole-organizing protein PopZ